jgi:hypothetical protein
MPSLRGWVTYRLRKRTIFGVAHLLPPENRLSLKRSSICAIRCGRYLSRDHIETARFLSQHKCLDAHAARGCRRFRHLGAITTNA